MKNYLTIVFGSFIFFLILTGCTFPSWVPFVNQVSIYTCESLPIGVLIGADGDAYADEQRDGYELALREINDSGGINDCPVELIYQVESQAGNPDYAKTAVRSLIEDEKVIAVVGGTSDISSMFAASLVNYFEVPMIVPSAGGSHILPLENRWAFRLAPGEPAVAQTVFQMVKDELGGARKIAIVFEDSTFGHDAAAAAVAEIESRNLQVSVFHSYNSSIEGFDVVIEELQMIMPDVIYVILQQPQQAENFLTALRESQIPVRMLIVRNGGFAAFSFLYGEEGNINPLAERLIFVSQWNPTQEDEVIQNFLQDFAQFTKNKYGESHPPTQVNVEAYSSLIMLAGALERTMNSADVNMQDITSVRSGLRQVLQGYKTNMTPLAVIDLDILGQNQSQVFLTQVIDGQMVMIYPAEFANHAPVYNPD